MSQSLDDNGVMQCVWLPVSRFSLIFLLQKKTLVESQEEERARSCRGCR